MMAGSPENIIEIRGLRNYLGGRWVHDGLDLTVKRGEIIAIIGSSGCGKTTLLQTILMLRKQTEGEISVFGLNTLTCSLKEPESIRARWGVMFQSGALFSSLSVLENIMFPIQHYTHLSQAAQLEIAELKMSFAGLESEAGLKYPSELSGGMKKRAAMARAIALDPELIFLDEPTAGLDPHSADDLDRLVLDLRDNLGITFVMVTHDIDTLWRVPDRIVYLGEGKVLAAVSMPEIIKSEHPMIKEYFSGPRFRVREKTARGKDGGV
jgi:phospholipid/cholesterol/gamma-HCH transport system ATP-binding protein